MNRIKRIVLRIILGAFLCAVLAAGISSLVAGMDGTRSEEVIALAAVVGIIGSFVGAIIGLVVGLFDFGIIAGGITGVLAAVIVVVLYVVAFSRPGQVVYFFRESGIFLVFLGVPTTVTGIVLGLIKKLPQYRLK